MPVVFFFVFFFPLKPKCWVNKERSRDGSQDSVLAGGGARANAWQTSVSRLLLSSGRSPSGSSVWWERHETVGQQGTNRLADPPSSWWWGVDVEGASWCGSKVKGGTEEMEVANLNHCFSTRSIMIYIMILSFRNSKRGPKPGNTHNMHAEQSSCSLCNNKSSPPDCFMLSKAVALTTVHVMPIVFFIPPNPTWTTPTSLHPLVGSFILLIQNNDRLLHVSD